MSSFSFQRPRPFILAIFVLTSVLASPSVSAQSAPATPPTHFSHLNFTPPIGWKSSTTSGWMMFVPPDLASGQTAFIGISPGGESTRTLQVEFDALVKASQGGMTTLDSQPIKPSTDVEGIPTLQQTVTLQSASGDKLLRLYIGKKTATRFEAMTFTATPELATKYFPAFKELYKSLIYDDAPAPTTGGPAPEPQGLPNVTPPPNAKPQVGSGPGKPLPEGAPPLVVTDSGAVTKTSTGELIVAPDKGIGVKLSKHDKQMVSTAMVVGHDGSIHVAYVEATSPNTENAVYYRSSSDGGHTWTEAKNLSDVTPGYMVGSVQIAVDASDRVYVIWRVAGEPNVAVDADSHAGNLSSNVVYRVMENGQWNGAPLNVNPPANHNTQDKGAGSFFAGSDPTGNVHVCYALSTDVFHPELMYNAGTTYPQHQPGMGNGSVAQVDLKGTSHSTPREIFLAKVEAAVCDGLDTLKGYFDGSGAPHFTAYAYRRGEPDGANRIVIIEGGEEKPGILLPGQSFTMWYPPATLLLDSQGRKHVIAFFGAGEVHGVRDYILGSDSEPSLIRAAGTSPWAVQGFEAFQGPAGRMVVLMQMNDTDRPNHGELYVSMSSGDGWTKPVNVSFNAGRTKGTYTPTGVRSAVSTTTAWLPGIVAAANFDKQGRLILVNERDEYGTFGATARGITLVAGDSSIPRLYFMRF